MLVDMQLKTSDLLSLSQQLIPKQLALAFGIALGDDHHEEDMHTFSSDSSLLKGRGLREKPDSLTLKRQRDADASTDGRPATSAKAGPLPTSSQQTTPAPPPVASQPAASTAVHQMTSSMQQQDAAAMAHAAASMQAAALAQQAAASMQTTTAMAHAQAAAAAAASMQTTSSLSGGYPSHPAATASGGAGMLSAYRGYPAAAVGHAYHYNGHPLMPYMQASPQAMATMSNMSGSMGCGPMSMYSDYNAMQRQDEEAEDNQARALKRPRLVWTPQLHKIFEEAVQKLGVDKAVPKTIMQMMKVEGLTRENVASHLQKYRLSLKKTTDTDGKAANLSADIGAEGTAEASGSDKGGQEGGNGATTSTAAAGGRGSGTGGGTAVDGSSSGGDGVGSTGEGGTSTCEDKELGNGLVPRASEDADPPDRMDFMQQMSADVEEAAADGDAAVAAASDGTADADLGDEQ